MSAVFEWLRDNAVATFVTTLLSLGALGVAIAAIVVSAKSSKRSNKTQEGLLKIEKDREQDRLYDRTKACLTAQIVAVPWTVINKTVMKVLLRIENKGLAEARDIRVILDGKSVMEYATFTENQEKKEITQVGPKSYFDYLLGYGTNTPKPASAEISWADDSGESGEYRTTLTL